MKPPDDDDGPIDPARLIARAGPPCFTMETGPRLRYMPFAPNPKQAYFMATTCPELFFGGAGAAGKGLPLSQPVVTPHGFRAIGDLKVGDRVISPDGSESKVIAVHHRGVQPCWRVTFADGSAVTTDSDHLWTYRLANRPRNRDLDWKVATTPQLAEMVGRAARQDTKNKPWPYVPLTEPVKWNGIASRNATERWPVDPYALGVLLGDGRIGTQRTNLSFTSVDPQIVEAMGLWATSVGASIRSDGVTHTILTGQVGPRKSDLRRVLEALDVCHGAEHKAVPSRYLIAPLPTRMALMQGLMDTDGTVGTNGHASFTSVSPQLALDVQFLARSLGFNASMTDRVGKYRHPETGTVVECLTAYTVHISGRNPVDLFRLDRKRNRCRQPSTSTGARRVVSVDTTDPEPTVCITVDNPNGLFVTGHDFIVTHNSVALLGAALQFADVPGYSALILRRSLTDLTQPGALISMSREWLDGRPECKYNANERKWTFDTSGKQPATIQFGYLSHVQHVGRYRGSEYHYCVERTTPVLMADGSWRRICEVAVDDTVQTLEGPRRVTAVHRPGVKPVAHLSGPWGTVTVSDRHRLLTPAGWLSPEAIAASSIGGRTAGTGSSVPPQGDVPPRQLFAPLVLHGPAFQSTALGSFAWSGRRARDRDLVASAVPGWPGRYSTSPDRGDAGTHPVPGTPTHPYNSRPLDVRTEVVHLDRVCMDREGEAEVCDLTVEGASHYIVWGGIISSNCAWDELGEFPSAFPYRFLFSRVRRPAGVDRDEILRRFGAAPDGTTLLDIVLRVRATSNPGGPGMAWVKKRFVDPATRRAPYIPATFLDNPAIDAEQYRAMLAMLPEVERRRMELGDWEIQEIPGALWRLDDIRHHPWKREDGTNMFDRVYVGIDPSVGGGSDLSDECGIVAGGILPSGRVIVLADGSLHAAPDVWSQRAVSLHHDLGGSGIVIENNQGYELLRTQIRDAADQLGLPQPPVLLANAKGSKEFRAGTISSGYRNPQADPLIVHGSELRGGELEAQMVGWIPGAKKSETGVKSPDRVDALVWLCRGLLYPDSIDDFSQSVAPVPNLLDHMRGWR